MPVIKYNRNGFKPRPRQLILTQVAAYVIDDAKIKQRVLYTVLKGQNKIACFCFHQESTPPPPASSGIADAFCLLIAGISVSNLTDRIVVFHIMCEDPKEKVCECRSAGRILHLGCSERPPDAWRQTHECKLKFGSITAILTLEWPDAFWFPNSDSDLTCYTTTLCLHKWNFAKILNITENVLFF